MIVGLECLPVGGRGRRNRKWPDGVKALIMAKVLMPGVTVTDVVRRHGVPAHHVSSWRTLARKGRLVIPALMVGPVEDAPRTDTGAGARPEIISGAVVICLEAGATAERIASVVRALAANS